MLNKGPYSAHYVALCKKRAEVLMSLTENIRKNRAAMYPIRDMALENSGENYQDNPVYKRGLKIECLQRQKELLQNFLQRAYSEQDLNAYTVMAEVLLQSGTNLFSPEGKALLPPAIGSSAQYAQIQKNLKESFSGDNFDITFHTPTLSFSPNRARGQIVQDFNENWRAPQREPSPNSIGSQELDDHLEERLKRKRKGCCVIS